MTTKYRKRKWAGRRQFWWDNEISSWNWPTKSCLEMTAGDMPIHSLSSRSSHISLSISQTILICLVPSEMTIAVTGINICAGPVILAWYDPPILTFQKSAIFARSNQLYSGFAHAIYARAQLVVFSWEYSYDNARMKMLNDRVGRIFEFAFEYLRGRTTAWVPIFTTVGVNIEGPFFLSPTQYPR